MSGNTTQTYCHMCTLKLQQFCLHSMDLVQEVSEAGGIQRTPPLHHTSLSNVYGILNSAWYCLWNNFMLHL